jgi:hypothetical protein
MKLPVEKYANRQKAFTAKERMEGAAGPRYIDNAFYLPYTGSIIKRKEVVI